jgi:hypothetical protein
LTVIPCHASALTHRLLQYYRNLPEYKQLSSAASSQVQQLLRTARSSLTRPAAPAGRSLIASAGHNAAIVTNNDDDDDDPDGAMFNDLTAVLDDTLERLDAALDASQAATEQYKLGGWAAPAGSRQPYRVAAAAGGATAGSAARFSRVQRHIANLPRPQDAFPDAVDNSNSPWHPSCHAHLAPRLAAARAAAAADPLAAHAAQLAAAAAAAAAAAGGSSADAPQSPHPYSAELASLQYQPWQLQASAQPLAAAADFDAVPFTLVDTPEALAAMVQQLQGEQQIALDVEHHSYRWAPGWLFKCKSCTCPACHCTPLCVVPVTHGTDPNMLAAAWSCPRQVQMTWPSMPCTACVGHSSWLRPP